jgi:hypothetical protein
VIARLDAGPPACAFCRQAVATGEARSCRRCWAPYHVDCWEANGRRCGIYGCQPYPPAARAPEAPAAVAPSGCLWVGSVALVLLLFSAIAIRFLAGPPDEPAWTSPKLDVAMPGLNGPRPTVEEADALLSSGRSILVEMERARTEGAETSRRVELARRARGLEDGLERTGADLRDDRRRFETQRMRGRLRSAREALLLPGP